MTIGTVRRIDVASARQTRLLAALLDHQTPPWRRDELPPLGHWLMFPPEARQSALGADGHPLRHDDGLPRRMWAGSRVRFLAPIPVGSELIQETSEIASADKQGRSGRMRFVTLRHVIRRDGRPCIEEEQDIVYREPGIGGPPPPAVPADRPAHARTIVADPVQLFRFSALTFNAHRIHYDFPYATGIEGYPGLVVHGPLIATLLMDHFLRTAPATPIAAFSFRAQRPVFAGAPFTLGLNPDSAGAEMLAIDEAGGIAMRARIDL